MYSQLGVQRYKEADINSMSKEKMITLLFEKIESDLESAKSALAADNLVEMTNRVNHSSRIICELRGALDHDIGGDISRNLESLYDYMFHEHLDVIIDRDPVHLDQCLGVLRPLLDSWRKIPVGTGDQAIRDNSRGLIQVEKAGPEPASDDQEEPDGEKALPERTPGTVAEPQGKFSLSV